MSESLTAFDVIVLAIIGFCLIYALVKGFTTMVLTLFAWVGAIAIAMYGMPYASNLARSFISPNTLADFIALPVLFVSALFLLKLLANFIGARVRSGPVGLLDRSLGAALGLILGAVLVSSGYLFFNAVISEDNHPDWVRNARSKPLVSYGAAMVAKLGPDLFSKIDQSTQGSDLLDRMRETYSAGKDAVRSAGEAVYEDQQRQLLDNKLEEILNEQKDSGRSGDNGDR